MIFSTNTVSSSFANTFFNSKKKKNQKKTVWDEVGFGHFLFYVMEVLLVWKWRLLGSTHASLQLTLICFVPAIVNTYRQHVRLFFQENLLLITGKKNLRATGVMQAVILVLQVWSWWLTRFLIVSCIVFKETPYLVVSLIGSTWLFLPF